MTREAACDISFSEKARVFSQDYLRCCAYLAGSNDPKLIFTKMFFSRLVSTSQLLEDFLDFHGAKNNREWFYYRELSAAVRHISLGAYAQKHIINRLIFYDLENSRNFEEQCKKTLEFLTGCLRKLAPAILAEAKRLNIPVPAETHNISDFPAITTTEILDCTIDDEDKDLQKKNIVKIANEFLNIAAAFDDLAFFEPQSLDEIRRLVPEKVNEVEIRRFEMLVHNLQSSFDSYVIHGGYRFGNRRLKQLRGYFSVVFHLLQTIGRLLHFYERHLHKTGHKSTYQTVQERLSELIDPMALLDRTINHGLFFTCYFLTTGKDLALTIMNENIETSSVRVNVPVKLGFHMRPSLLVAKIVQHYGGQVELLVGEDRFDASSVLDLQWAGGKIQKENIQKVVFEGDARALSDIEILSRVNYGEDTMGKGIPLPTELHYLK